MRRPAPRARATSRGPSAMKSPLARRSRLLRSRSTSLTAPLSSEVITSTNLAVPARAGEGVGCSGERVFGARAALGRSQAAALGRDRAALDAVRRAELHLDQAL